MMGANLGHPSFRQKVSGNNGCPVSRSASYGNSTKSAGGNAGPNAIRQITYVGGGTTNYNYDANGNMLSGDGRTMTYNEFNKPLTITKGGVTSSFSYGANLLRYKQIKTGLSGGTQTSYYVDKLLEVEKQGNRTTYRHYFDGVAVLHKEVVAAATTWTMGFNLKDRLGSVVTLADENGDVLEHRSYDPFGKPRRGDFIDAGTIQSAIALDPHPEYSLDPLTDRGFTDHEHLDEQQIIHMNGRVFDYNIGRFSSVDPFIAHPTNSQSTNPYSYIMNNPLSGVDPSGYRDLGDRAAAAGFGLRQGLTNSLTAEEFDKV
jgi:RHS repeat-associated protein